LTSEIPYRRKGFDITLVGGLDNNDGRKKLTSFIPKVKLRIVFYSRSYPVSPGSQIVVPERPEVKKLSTGEVVSIGSVIVSLALLIVTALNNI
jgi:hypothetical protein